MGNRLLLDCTLRDGGYLNNWAFTESTMTDVLERMVSAGVDVIELGFLNENEPFDPNRSMMPDTASVKKIYGRVDHGRSMVVAMIDYGTCSVAQLQPRTDSYLDGIRVIFKKKIMHEAIAFCHEVKALGYEVFAQAVSITSYSDEELMELIGLINGLKPFAASMVDTYGLLHQSNLLHIFELMDRHLDPEIALGYHAHNNFQLGYANCIEMLNRETERTVLVDGSLYGMGKSAGNTPIELIAMYMNERFQKSYDVSQMLEAIETCILDQYRLKPWGYNLFYYVAASNKCHPNYVSYLMDKRTLSVKSINQVLQLLEGEKRLNFDKALIEKLYLDYQRNALNDTEARIRLRSHFSGRTVLALGPGRSMLTAQTAVTAYAERERPVIVAVNDLPGWIAPDYLFVTNAKRYARNSTRLLAQKKVSIIATSNVTESAVAFPFVLDFSSLIDEAGVFPDNSLLMLLKLLLDLDVAAVTLAGFDGYVENEMNYYDTNMEYGVVRGKAEAINNDVRAFLTAHGEALHVQFLTPSQYGCR